MKTGCHRRDRETVAECGNSQEGKGPIPQYSSNANQEMAAGISQKSRCGNEADLRPSC